MKRIELSCLCGGLALFCIPLLLGSKAPTPNPATTHRNPVERGKYLVAYGGCSDCHTPLKMGPTGPEPDLSRYLAGHPQEAVLPQPPALPMDSWSVATAGLTAWSGPWGISYAANLTPDVNTGMGIWTEEIFINAMRTGRHFGVSRPILPPMPWQGLAGLTDEDLRAIYAYLRSIKPIENRVPEAMLAGQPVHD
jgi:hypothetical protein